MRSASSGGLVVDEGFVEIIVVHGIIALLFVDAEVPETTGNAADTDDATNDDSDGDTSSLGGVVILSSSGVAAEGPLKVGSLLPVVVEVSALSGGVVSGLVGSSGGVVLGVAGIKFGLGIGGIRGKHGNVIVDIFDGSSSHLLGSTVLEVLNGEVSGTESSTEDKTFNSKISFSGSGCSRGYL